MTDKSKPKFTDLLNQEQLRAYCEILERSNADLQEQLRECRAGIVNILAESPSELYH